MRRQISSRAGVSSTASRRSQTESDRPSNSAARPSSGAAPSVAVRYHAVAIAADHGQRPAREVAVLVGQLGVVARLEGLRRDLAVRAEADLSQQVEAQRVGPVELGDLEGLDDVAQRLGHLVLAQQQEAVDGHLLRHLEPGGHQHRRPDDRVELEDVLADQLDRRGPELARQVLAVARVGERRVVVEQGVDPDVDDLRVVPRHGHAPLEPRAAQRDVAQPAPEERVRLVVAVAGGDEAGPIGVQLLERLLEGGEPEEPVVLLLDLQHDLVDRAAVAVLELGVGLEVGAARAVPALVVAGIDVAVVVNALDDLGDLLHVLAIRGADEEVVRHVERGRQLAEADRVAIPELPRGDAERLRRLGYRLAVLVGAREEEDVLAPLAHVARENVGGDRRVRVPQMRLAVHVVDGRGDVVRHGTSMLLAPPRSPGRAAASSPPRQRAQHGGHPAAAAARGRPTVLREAEQRRRGKQTEAAQ